MMPHSLSSLECKYGTRAKVVEFDKRTSLLRCGVNNHGARVIVLALDCETVGETLLRKTRVQKKEFFF